MARTLGESVGETVGLRVRFGSKISARTRIEVVTEGVFTRLILDDPALDGIAAVLFDEFHERSLDADLGLALARDAQTALREDVRLLVMSATLDAARIARLLGDAPVVESAGRAFPVETRYVGRDARIPIEPQVADVTTRALRAESGSVLVFLPGAAEIRRTEALLRARVADLSIAIVPLYGALDRDVQDQAIAPAAAGQRKVVLATSIAETSITIEGVRIVVDCGLARVPRYEPDVGLTRLETVRVSRAAADQRRGRAGRTESGICLRLWDEPQSAALEPFTRPEILAADLSSFVLDLAHWGTHDPASLAFLDTPPAAAMTEARTLLRDLGALDTGGRITPEGRRLRELPLPPRLARMVLDAARSGSAIDAAHVAAVITERGLGGDDGDLTHRLEAFRRDRSGRADEVRKMARRWADTAEAFAAEEAVPSTGSAASGLKERGKLLSVGALLALAYPDRVAKNRGDQVGGFLLANGRGGAVDLASSLARQPFLVIAELSGVAARGRILLAAPIPLDEIEALFADRIIARDEVVFDVASASLRARRTRRLGAVMLTEHPQSVAPGAESARLLAENIGRSGLERLPWTATLRQWRERVLFLRRVEGEEWPDLGDAALTVTAAEWLAPALHNAQSFADVSVSAFAEALHGLLPWSLRQRLDDEAPMYFNAPSGSHIPIAYGGDEPKIALRVQELFGLDRHPMVARGRAPLVVELLSPAHRPMQVTRDLPGFWRGSYAAVRTEMRGRYPKHPWPENPLAAPATHRAKPRGT
jgi:ATP-dependent helicase HrpB